MEPKKLCDECTLIICEYKEKEESCPHYQSIKLLHDYETETQHEKDMIDVQQEHQVGYRGWRA